MKARVEVMEVEKKVNAPLFETRTAKGRKVYRVFAASMLACICSIWAYRVTHLPSHSSSHGEESFQGRWWVWIGLLSAELWFGFYWILNQSVRWNPIYHSTFKDRLSQRYREDELPSVDVFVCTANPQAEPPSLVVSTVLSVMAYDYPSEKLCVYLSDDGCSDLTFYALVEASIYAKYWLPFCHNFEIEPRSPTAYFSTVHHPSDTFSLHEWNKVKKLHEEMVQRIDEAVKLGRVPEDMKARYKGFKEWDSGVNPYDHQPIVQLVVDGRKRVDGEEEAFRLPTLVYMSREKKTYHHHNFKAGAMNALIRVSSEISNGDFILNVDCDMFSNNSSSIRDALCFFLDEERGHQIGFVQYPQYFNNCTRNDIYASAFKVINKVEIPGLDGLGGATYIGTGCFHRRESLCGMKYTSKNIEGKWKVARMNATGKHVTSLEEIAKQVATCDFEDNTLWGKEVGLKYGCSAEDVITGMLIHCRGWKSVHFNPTQRGFLGIAPMNLGQTLVQNQRWSEGLFQFFLSQHCPFLYGHGKINLGHQMGYSVFALWAANSIPTLIYVTIPSVSLLKGVSLYPKVLSIWFLPFAYVIIAKHLYSLGESLSCNDTLKGWWNIQRMWVFKRITSYLFGTIDALLNRFGFARTRFVVTSKVADDEMLRRYRQERLDFSAAPPAFTAIIATAALLNLLCLMGGVWGIVVVGRGLHLEGLFLQIVLCGVVVLLNLPVYKAMLLGGYEGSIPLGISLASVAFACVGMLVPIA